MTPWTALWVAVLALSIRMQSGNPARSRVWVGRGLAVVVGVLACATLVEYATARSLGIDQFWFGAAVRSQQLSWPGRPGPQAAAAVLLLATAVALTRVDRRGVGVVWPVCLAGGGLIPLVAVVAYLFDAETLVQVRPSTGIAMLTAVAAILLVTVASAARPDRVPLVWLLARPDRVALLRLYGLAVGVPVFVSLGRLALLALGMNENAAFALSVTLATVVAAMVGFRLRRQEQHPLIEQERLSRERAEAERRRAEAEGRYRILADNSVDIVVHLREGRVVWISPSVEGPFGDPPQKWIGSDYLSHVHPDDVDNVRARLQEIGNGNMAAARYRIRADAGAYHWVDAHGKPYIDAEGNADGATGSMRVVDDRVEAEQRLDRLARFDILTGLPNRAEALGILEGAIAHARSPGADLGVLFCDIDHFKDINDTWGHAVGDAVLATMARRVRESVRQGDMVGRIGGDEMLVVLFGLHGYDEAVKIADVIRCRAAEPIHESGRTVHATLSIGATLAVPGESVSSIIGRADTAMYQAKLGGRNAVVRIESTEPRAHVGNSKRDISTRGVTATR
ncbi:diguanylate cyclase domain-containing protein [Mycobacterium sp. HM-7]